MPRYTDVDDLLEALKNRRLIFEEGKPVEEAIAEQISVFEEVIEEVPTVDVVPKSEYDAVVSAVDNSTKEFLKLHDTYQKQKSEVVDLLDDLIKEAREIANRYEKSANETSDYDYARIEYRGCQMGALIVSFKIAELKKKYT